MKPQLRTFLAAALCLGLVSAHAQPGSRSGGMGGGGPGPKFDAAMSKLFGDNSNFSSAIEIHNNGKSGSEDMTIPGKISYSEGKSRFEMDMTQMKGGNIPPNAAEQIKAMGMSEIVMITLPDKKMAFMMYPGLEAYAEMPMRDLEAATNSANYKIELTEIGKETVDGHACVKNKAVVTDDKGKTHEFVIWNAADVKNFPIKIETTDQGQTVDMLFKDIKLAKPEASLFDPPASYKRYASMQEMMQTEMMKRMGGGAGGPPGKP
jgi:hypothetical protein